MGPDGKYNATGGGRYPCVRNYLLGGGASGSVVQIVIVVHVGDDDKYGGGNSYKITKSYHMEEGAEKHIWDVGDTGGRRGIEGIWNEYSGQIQQLQAGDGGAVGSSKTYI